MPAVAELPTHQWREANARRAVVAESTRSLSVTLDQPAVAKSGQDNCRTLARSAREAIAARPISRTAYSGEGLSLEFHSPTHDARGGAERRRVFRCRRMWTRRLDLDHPGGRLMACPG